MNEWQLNCGLVKESGAMERSIQEETEFADSEASRWIEEQEARDSELPDIDELLIGGNEWCSDRDFVADERYVQQ